MPKDPQSRKQPLNRDAFSIAAGRTICRTIRFLRPNRQPSMADDEAGDFLLPSRFDSELNSFWICASEGEFYLPVRAIFVKIFRAMDFNALSA